MNLDRIINMVINQVVRRLVRGGVNKGFNVAGDQMSKLKKRPQDTESELENPHQQSG